MKRIIIIFALLLVSSASISGMFYFKKNKVKQVETKIEDVENNTSKENKLDEETITEENSIIKDEEPKKEENEVITPKKEEIKKNDNKTSNQTTSNSTIQSNNSQPSSNIVAEQPKQPEPVKETGPWGMTKDQYYNQPMHSWERVDFSTMDQCLKHGDNYEPYLNGEVLYNCREVTSASGRFLGVMFDTEKLN